MATGFCPNCGAARSAGRFCAQCGRDLETVGFAVTTTGSIPPAALLGGVAWIVTALFTGYLALLQLGTAGDLERFGLNPGDLRSAALLNGTTAALTVFFGARLLTHPTPGFLGASVAWGVLNVAWGAYQVANGATHWAFIGGIVAAAAAGILSFVARSEMRVEPPAPFGQRPVDPRATVTAESAIPPALASAPLGASAPALASVSPTGSRRRPLWVEIFVVALIAAALGAGRLLLASNAGLINKSFSANIPPVGSIWFGDSYDPATFEVHARTSSVAKLQSFSAVAHLNRSMKGSNLSLRVAFNGSDRGTNRLSWTGDSEVWGFSPGPVFDAGSWKYDLVDSGGNVLASGTISAH